MGKRATFAREFGLAIATLLVFLFGAPNVTSHVLAADPPIVTDDAPPPVADCNTPLQTLVDAAPAGSVLKVPPCTYRETVVVSKPLTLDGQGRAEIHGSDEWTGWTQLGNNNGWVSQNTVPVLDGGNTGPCADGSNRCNRYEQVFRDGTLLHEVDPGTAVGTGQFALDNARHVVMGDDPTNHWIEVSTRVRWIDTQSDNVTIENFIMWDAANPAQVGALGNQGHSGWTLTGNKLYWAHGAIVTLGPATDSSSPTQVTGNEIVGSGFEGITAFQTNNLLIQGNLLKWNNLAGFDTEWAGGGVKLVSVQNATVDNNSVTANNGHGLWADIQSHNVTFSNNRVHDNDGIGIFFEISVGAKITNNAVWNLAGNWPAIYISSSADADVSNNVLAWNSTGISAQSVDRPDRPVAGTTGVSIHDNTIVASNSNVTAIEWLQSGTSTLFRADSGNRGANNAYWYPGDEDGEIRFRWDSAFPRLSDFKGTNGGAGGRYLSIAERDQQLSASNIPLAPPAN